MNSFFGMTMGICFAYSLVEILLMQPEDCMISMQNWLLVSYANVIVFRCVQKIGQRHSEAGKHFIFSFRQRSVIARAAVVFTWSVLLPFFVTWAVFGTVWFLAALAQHPGSMFSGSHPWLVMFWLLLSYLWVSGYLIYFGIACVVEHRVRSLANNMREIETEETLLRWGPLGTGIDDSGPLALLSAVKPANGLQPSDIHCLPCEEVFEDLEAHGSDRASECPICLSDFSPGDKIRSLPGCGHCFHQACIDLWLLRRADCPMCKGSVHKTSECMPVRDECVEIMAKTSVSDVLIRTTRKVMSVADCKLWAVLLVAGCVTHCLVGVSFVDVAAFLRYCLNVRALGSPSSESTFVSTGEI